MEVKDPLLKRPFDFILSTLGIFLSSPLWLLISIAIKLEDWGNIFFVQDRWGRYGAVIKVRKFRTMMPHADNHSAKENDHRVTRVGKLLRATGMDELPQLLSIWKGDMSLVGPRALAVDEILFDEGGNQIQYQDIPGFWERLSGRPGLTSISTVYERKDIRPRKKFRYDILYIKKQSFWLDLYLVLMSFWISIRGKWESRDGKL